MLKRIIIRNLEGAVMFFLNPLQSERNIMSTTAKIVTDRKVRYGVVGCGWIAQGYFMPGVGHTGNSELTALVSGDPEKRAALGKKYDIENTYSYEEFPDMLEEDVVDAIYVSTPNWLHTDYAVAALEAGVHVLLEKPMAIGLEDCEKIMEAQRKSGAKLMIAYRLHFEPGNLAALKMAREGKLGEVQYFGSTFAQIVKPQNQRARNGYEGGPVYDMGPYPINAVRNFFGEEPLEVSAVGYNNGLGDFDDTVCVTLKFSKNRAAQFVLGYALAAVDEYRLLGTKGFLQVNPAFQVGMQIEHRTRFGEKTDHDTFKETDHFGGETKYFSQCIIEGRDPEPDGEEGWCDVRVIEAIRQSLETGKPVTLEPYKRKRQIALEQEQRLGTVSVPKFVDAEKPAA